MTSYADLAIETVNLTKTFGDTRAVDGIDLVVNSGSIYGVLGPNGAGKTTLIRMLATLLRPSSGTARVLSHDLKRDPHAIRERISLTGQFGSVDEDLTGIETLLLLGRFLGLGRRAARTRAGDLLEAFGLTDAAKRQVKTYSGGMKRRIDIAASMIVTPELLFLDEPTTGLDPRSRNQVWEMVRAIAANGTTVVLTTQYLDEADHLADRIAVIDQGKMVAEGTSGQLKASIGAGALHLRLVDSDQRTDAEHHLARILRVQMQRDADPFVLWARIPAQVDSSEAGGRVASALAELTASGIPVSEFSLGQPSLDEVFLALTGHSSHREPEKKESLA
ncbi:MAG: ATP-binding cassette domain-containing protein [Nitrolancea sp.]